MNFKRIISMILAFVMLAVCLVSAPVVYAETSSAFSDKAAGMSLAGSSTATSTEGNSKVSAASLSSKAQSSSNTTLLSGVSSANSSSESSSNTSGTSSADKPNNTEKLYSGIVNVDSDTLSVRMGPDSASTLLGSLRKGEIVVIHGEAIDGTDKRKWYKIDFENKMAYVCADYITNLTEKEPPAEYVPDATFEENLTKQKFPESYKVLLRKLHAEYPNWIFLADHLDLTWEEALATESAVGKSLVSNSRPNSYKSMEYGAYNWENGTYVGFDGSSWVTAHKDIVAYFMEPRNFLNESGIYQFLDQSFNEKLQSIEGINKIILNTFMANPFPEKTYKSYAELLFDAGKKSLVNPYVLAAMIIQEQGRKGENGLISGKYPGYEGYYNHFNIGAYSSGGLNAVQRGLKYATGALSSDKIKEKYGLPWNTIAKSILGGAKWYGSGYIEVGQDTLYYKKFDFIGPSFYTHQYMSNIEGANSEARLLKTAYVDIADNTALTFSIPVFKDMPQENKTSLPEQSGANNYYLSSISIGDLSLTPKFDMYTNNYELVVDTAVKVINVSATAVDGAKVSGAGEYTLKDGENIITLTVTAASGRTKNYVLSVARRAGGAVIVPEPKITVDSYNFGTNITGIQPETTVETFKSKIKITDGTMKLLDKDGKEKNTGNISTGDKIIIYKTDNKEYINKNIVVYGDVSGDGKISIIDLASVQKHILKVKEHSGANFAAADTNKDGKVSIIDLANVQKHILKVKTITQ